MTTALPSSTRARITALGHEHPEWHSWLALCEATLHALEDPVWRTIELRPCPTQPPGVPLLDGMELIVDGTAVRTWVQHISKHATARQTGRDKSRLAGDFRRSDALALLEAAARQDLGWIQALADSMQVEVRAVHAYAQLAVMPLLQECRRRLADNIPIPWAQGYCPFCGAWAVVAEVRGLDRTRHLRCGRCGGDWRTGWLRCSFCEETRHERLAFLVPDGQEERQRIETCASCQGYLKSLTTLQGAAPHAVMLDDLATVTFDMVAVERGYARPQRPGYCITLRLTERERSFSSLLRRFM